MLALTQSVVGFVCLVSGSGQWRIQEFFRVGGLNKFS
jgi:hypothetical protein